VIRIFLEILQYERQHYLKINTLSVLSNVNRAAVDLVFEKDLVVNV
jgi:hypothetical protein